MMPNTSLKFPMKGKICIYTTNSREIDYAELILDLV